MIEQVAGIHIHGRTLPEMVALILRAERAGVPSVWLTGGGLGADSLTTIAVAAARTERIKLGTSIAVTFLRHPLAMIQQAIAIEQVAPGRFRLGIGTGHRPTIEDVYGLAFERPLEQLREYAQVLRQAFEGGRIDFEGKRFRVHARIPDPPAVPIYLSALRAASYRLAGELADGAISWVSPSSFLRDTALPALRAGAAGREARAMPRLVGHAFGLVSDDEAAVRQAGRERLVRQTRLTFYQEMFAAAGYPEARERVVSEELVQDLVLTGSEDEVARGIRRFFDCGVDELILTLLPAGQDPDAGVERTLRLLGSRELASPRPAVPPRG